MPHKYTLKDFKTDRLTDVMKDRHITAESKLYYTDFFWGVFKEQVKIANTCLLT